MKLISFVKIVLLFFTVNFLNAQFVHPGISHKLSDLERMKYMVEAGIEPWATTFQNLSSHSRAQYDIPINVVNEDPSYVIEFNASSDAWLINDSTTAYFNALMWYFTGDSRHAEKAIEVFTTYSTLRRNTQIPLVSGRIVRLIEAAEIIKHTYNGWSESDRQAFEDMLVYPGYSNTTLPTAAIASNDVTFYWKIYNGDPARIGNQGLLAMRVMMAMGIFLDNERMYDRAVRYIQGYPHRVDDLPYPSGPAIRGALTQECEFGRQYSLDGFESTIEDYGYNEVIKNYIYDNGQSQESSRDQAHALGGVTIINGMSEIAWNQGDNVYGHLDNRPLLGMEFYIRYNLSYEKSYPDQPSPWEPTFESGEYYQKTTPHKRRELLKINPGVDCDQTNWTRGINNLSPVYEMSLAHYRDRLQTLPPEDYKWLERGNEHVMEQQGYEGLTSTIAFPLYGSLFYRRVSPGDPISGFDVNGLPVYEMNELSMTIEAENYDYFVLEGQDRTYSDSVSGNSGGAYRTDEAVDLKVCSEGGYNITDIADGEWLTYTVSVPTNGKYNLSIRYASANGNGKIKFSFDGDETTPEVTVPFGGAHSTGLTDWKDLKVGSEVSLAQGVHQMKILFSGANNAFELNNITVALVEADPDPVNLAVLHGVASQSIDSDPCPYGGCAENAIDGNTNGNFGGGSVSHSAHGTSGSLKWWKVDLQNNYNIETINIYNRTGGYQSRLSDLTVEIKDSNGNTVYSEFFAGYPDPSWTLDIGGVVGQEVIISKTTDTGITLAEVEVFGVDKAVTLSNQDFELENTVKLYPNPASNLLNIVNAQNSKVSVFNILGKQVLEKYIQLNKDSLNMSTLTKGVYFVRISKDGANTIKKVIKQ
ncbi:carbohydrate-binding protein [Tamlana sp. 62-3]|uniref:Carbohydrate-binding protein n=1 Tax=Neotamlana sargassicola TaxID=2883125 RepID=A0A9X1I7W8_9FLAO|nr:carbohydrate-binding protein [Tamlana sargassicola]MCB4807954.1 carbohydrate-binding protein [Tamlana sargassicola]